VLGCRASLNVPQRILDAPERISDVREQAHTNGREADLTVMALKQCHAEPRLERLNLLAHRAGGHAKHARGGRYAAGAPRLDESAQAQERQRSRHAANLATLNRPARYLVCPGRPGSRGSDSGRTERMAEWTDLLVR
jgi:hypothetical protein